MLIWLFLFVLIGLVGVFLHELTHALAAVALEREIDGIHLRELRVDVAIEDDVDVDDYLIGASPLLVGLAGALVAFSTDTSVPLVVLGGWGVYTFGGVPNDFLLGRVSE